MTLLLLEIAIAINILIALGLLHEYRQMRKANAVLAGVVKLMDKVKADLSTE